MRDITLNCEDCVETVLPLVEEAMETGEICRISNIDYLGRQGLAALILLAMANCLMDSTTGRMLHRKPGFGLMAIDRAGVARLLTH